MYATEQFLAVTCLHSSKRKRSYLQLPLTSVLPAHLPPHHLGSPECNVGYWKAVTFSLHLWWETSEGCCLGSITFPETWKLIYCQCRKCLVLSNSANWLIWLRLHRDARGTLVTSHQSHTEISSAPTAGGALCYVRTSFSGDAVLEMLWAIWRCKPKLF